MHGIQSSVVYDSDDEGKFNHYLDSIEGQPVR